MTLPQNFFINGFTLNGQSMDNYKLITITKPTDRITFDGILTSFVQKIMRNGVERTFDNSLLQLVVSLNIITDGNPPSITTVDSQIASIHGWPGSKNPLHFKVELNPFGNEEFDISKLQWGTYSFNIYIGLITSVDPLIDTIKEPRIRKLLSNDLLIRIDLDSEVTTYEK